jgi:hypothetical protein
MILNAYYLNGSIHSLVPRHVREDFQWMADHGTEAVSISMYERDLGRRPRWDLLYREAERAGLRIHAVPSRWGGLVAGWPAAPSHFAATHPETWMLSEDGTPNFRPIWGPMSSVHHPATMELFRQCLDQVLAYPVGGIIWDEPKTLSHADFSPPARRAMPPGAGADWHVDAAAEFFDAAGAYAKARRPDLVISMFLYAWYDGYPVERCARIRTLDYFGCDGRPWTAEEDRQLHGGRDDPKVLVPTLKRWIGAARAAGKGAFVLIETQGEPSETYPVVDRRLPEVLSYGADHVAYYYYARDLDDPDRLMAIQGRHLKALRRPGGAPA